MDDFRESKVYRTALGMRPHERKDFKKWLDSPIIVPQNGEREILVRFFDAVLKVLNRKSSLREDEMFRKVFPSPEKKYSQSYFRRLGSRLIQLHLQFLSFENYRSDPYSEKIHRLNALLDKRQDKELTNELSQLQAEFDDPSSVGFGWWRFHYELALLQSNQLGDATKRKGGADFEDVLQKLDFSYHCEKLLLHCRMVNQALALGGKEYSVLDRAWVEEMLGSEQELLRIYALIYSTLTLPSDHSFYFQLKALLTRAEDKYDPILLLNWYQYLLNFCSRRVNENQRDFLSEYMDLFEFLFKKGLILDSQSLLHVNQFKNIVTTIAEVARVKQKPVMLRNFLDQYGDRLAGKEGAIIAAQFFGESLLNLVEGRYGQAVKGFNEVLNLKVYVDWFFVVASRVYICQALFERNEEEDREYLLRSCKAAIRFIKFHQDTISPAHSNRFLEFFRVLQSLQKVRELPSGNKRVQKLELAKQEMEEIYTLVARSWLTDMVDLCK